MKLGLPTLETDFETRPVEVMNGEKGELGMETEGRDKKRFETAELVTIREEANQKPHLNFEPLH